MIFFKTKRKNKKTDDKLKIINKIIYTIYGIETISKVRIDW